MINLKLTVLVDNNTIIDRYFLGEPGLSFYIEDGSERVLFDTGYSDILLKNARAMGIDIDAVDTVVISHGHNDHTGGLAHLPFDLSPKKKIVAHPLAFDEKYYDGEYIGSPMNIEQLRERAELCLSASPVRITENLTFLGEIPRVTSFETKTSLGDDPLLDDSALVYNSGTGLFVITGCSHSGICNIVERAKKVCGDERIIGVIGGFHLFRVGTRVRETARYLAEQNMKYLLPCHCVSFAARAAIHAVAEIQEVGVGFSIEV